MTFSQKAEVILINWRRPTNLPKIIASFRNQTAKCKITVCDVGGADFGLSKEVLATVDAHFVWNTNHGGFNRFIPAFSYECEYCWFHDDDMLPGPRLLEYLLTWQHLPFSVLGQTGRRIFGQDYKFLAPSKVPQQVDFVCRGYFLRTNRIPHILRYANAIGLSRYLILEDDILMAAAIQAYTGERAWMTPEPPQDAKMNAFELAAPHACQDMPDHYPRRIAFFNSCRTMTRRLAHVRPRVFLVGMPSEKCTDLLAHARALGIRAWLAEHFSEFDVIAPGSNDNELLRFALGDDDWVVCLVGESLPENALLGTGKCMGILQRFTRNRIIILGQNFSDPAPEHSVALEGSIKQYVEHQHLLMVTTDSFSQTLAKQWLLTEKITALVPDFALNLPLFDNGIQAQGEHVLVCLKATEDIGSLSETVADQLSATWQTVSTEEKRVTEGIRAWAVGSRLAEFRTAGAVVTNHFAGLAFAYLSRRPTVILPSTDAAFMASFEWFHNCRWIQRVESPTEIRNALKAAQSAFRGALPLEAPAISERFNSLVKKLREKHSV